jgi:protein FAM32A
MKPVFVGGSLSFKGDKKAKKKKSKAKHSVKSSATESESISHGAVVGGANDAEDAADGMTTPRAPAPHDEDLLEADLTDAERKALTKRRERELHELEKLATKSHRERVEEFNEKLASLTEHNDIPRVRADRRLCFIFMFLGFLPLVHASGSSPCCSCAISPPLTLLSHLLLLFLSSVPSESGKRSGERITPLDPAREPGCRETSRASIPSTPNEQLRLLENPTIFFVSGLFVGGGRPGERRDSHKHRCGNTGDPSAVQTAGVPPRSAARPCPSKGL